MKYILLFALFLLCAGKATAQELSLGIYPPLLRIEVTPPAQSKAELTVQNLTGQEQELTIQLRAFKPASTFDGSINYTDDLSAFPDPLLFQKVKVLQGEEEIKTLTMAPNSSENLSVQVDIAEGDPLGDYYFSVIFVSGAPEIDERSHTQIPGGIATNVLLSVGKKGETSGFIQRFETSFFRTQGPVPFVVLLSNTSDHIVSPTGSITIKNMFGQSVGKLDLLQEYVLNNSSRYIRDIKQASPSGEIVEDVEEIQQKKVLAGQRAYPIALWPETFLFGVYKADISMILETDGRPITESLYFVALPIYFLVGVILFISLVLGIIYKVKKKV